MKVLFVCMGNICRSPTAEGIFRDLLKKESITHIRCESRGTGGWHVGEPPDPRSEACALEFGVDISDLRASQFTTYDFEIFDLILVMDDANYREVVRQAKDESDKKKVKYLMEFAPSKKSLHVPDPYHGGHDGFRHVFKQIEEACKSLLKHLKNSES